MFLLYIEANSVSNNKGQKTKASEDGCKHGALMEFSLKDLYAIQEIQSEENLFKLIVKYVWDYLKFYFIMCMLGVLLATSNWKPVKMVANYNSLDIFRPVQPSHWKETKGWTVYIIFKEGIKFHILFLFIFELKFHIQFKDLEYIRPYMNIWSIMLNIKKYFPFINYIILFIQTKRAGWKRYNSAIYSFLYILWANIGFYVFS